MLSTFLKITLSIVGLISISACNTTGNIDKHYDKFSQSTVCELSNLKLTTKEAVILFFSFNKESNYVKVNIQSNGLAYGGLNHFMVGINRMIINIDGIELRDNQIAEMTFENFAKFASAKSVTFEMQSMSKDSGVSEIHGKFTDQQLKQIREFNSTCSLR